MNEKAENPEKEGQAKENPEEEKNEQLPTKEELANQEVKEETPKEETPLAQESKKEDPPQEAESPKQKESKPEETKQKELPQKEDTPEPEEIKKEKPPQEEPPEKETAQKEDTAKTEEMKVEETSKGEEERPSQETPSQESLEKAFKESISNVPIPFALKYINHFSLGPYFFFISKMMDLVYKKEPEKIATKETSSSAPHKLQQIFVIMGKREAMNNDFLLFLEEIGIKPIYLQDKVHTRESMEQHFFQYPNVKFAAALLSGDDFVYDKQKGKPGNASLMAKQNFVFYLGYLTAKLGKQNVFILYHEQKSLLFPIGHHQAIYTQHTKDGRWKDIFINRLINCGYQVSKQDAKNIQRCESCGFPMRTYQDHGADDLENRYCKYCAPEGTLKSQEEVRTGWIKALIEKEHFSKRQATEKVEKTMPKMPAWKKSAAKKDESP